MKVKVAKADKSFVNTSLDIYEILNPVLMRQSKIHRQKEYFWVIGLHSDNSVMYVELSAIGILNQCIIDPVEVFSYAVLKKCKRLIIAHNHPSGNLEPSREDITLTKKLISGGNLLNIKILDHIIITEQNYASLYDLGHMVFDR
jgi:DNA repair protein RadC